MLDVPQFCTYSLRKATLFADGGEGKAVFAVEETRSEEVPALGDEEWCEQVLRSCRKRQTNRFSPDVEMTRQREPAWTHSKDRTER